LSTVKGYSGYGAEQGEKVCCFDIFRRFFPFFILGPSSQFVKLKSSYTVFHLVNGF